MCLGIGFRLKTTTFSPLVSREALKNVGKASPGLFMEHLTNLVPLGAKLVLKFQKKRFSTYGTQAIFLCQNLLQFNFDEFLKIEFQILSL